jgi:DNA-binding PadR family transcriptional regulator
MTIRDLDAALLAAVAQLDPEAYGVAVRLRAGELLGGVLPSTGTVHQGLTRLEREGMVTARMGDPTPVRGGRARRLFSLTTAGARALAKARKDALQRAAGLARDWRPA